MMLCSYGRNGFRKAVPGTVFAEARVGVQALSRVRVRLTSSSEKTSHVE